MRNLMFLSWGFILLAGCSPAHQNIHDYDVKTSISIQFHLTDEFPKSDTMKMKIKGTENIVYLYIDSVLDQTDIESASVRRGDKGMYDLIIFFTITGSKKFSDITATNIGRRLGLVVDGELLSAPVITGRIPGREVVIAGKFTEEETKDIANRINLTVKK